LKNFVDIQEIGSSQLRNILEDSAYLKKSRTKLLRGELDTEPALSGRIVALLFKKPSTRTRFSFDVGITQMGGKSISISSNEMQLSNAEKMTDTAQVLSQYVDKNVSLIPDFIANSGMARSFYFLHKKVPVHIELIIAIL